MNAVWAALSAVARRDAERGVRALFRDEPDRLERLTLDVAGLHLDLSKQPWSAEGLSTALRLLDALDLPARRAALFGGEAVNRSEGRAVLHPALRAPEGEAFSALGVPVDRLVRDSRAALRAFADAFRAGEVTGATGRPLRSVVHIGIGGSDLGPRLVWEALRPLDGPVELRFAANVDPYAIAAALHGLDPAETLVVVVSKTFGTQETLANAEAARAWLREALGEDVSAHFAAVSAAPARAAEFGVPAERVFGFEDWVGGRFSVWSAVGLSVAVGLGWPAFQAFLDGAAAMDRHFRDAPPARSAPVLMALAEVFNRNGLDRRARAVVPYAERLRLLPAFLQQLEMESNGKAVTPDGRPAAQATSPVVFGEAGTNGQHAFFQMLHQGTDVVPVDVVLVGETADGRPELQRKLLANGIAQAEAFLVGRTEDEVRAELQANGVPADAIDVLAPQKTFTGDRPSTVLLLDRLDPASLGALLALYEHKVFVEGVLWDVNSFDQWGVELGKVLANRILPELEGAAAGAHDPSTAALIARLRN